MRRAYLALIKEVNGSPYILLARKNIYLTPCGPYKFAKVSRNGIQYVIPNCKVGDGINDYDYILEETANSLGLTVQENALTQLVNTSDLVAWYAFLPDDVSVDTINRTLSLGGYPYKQYQRAVLFPLEAAFSILGNQTSVHGEEWVTDQVRRAVAAGFNEALINERINQSHAAFTWIMAKLITEANLTKTSCIEASMTHILSAPVNNTTVYPVAGV